MQTLEEAEVEAETRIEEFQSRRNRIDGRLTEVATLEARRKKLRRGHPDRPAITGEIKRLKKANKHERISAEDRVRYAEAVRFLRGMNHLPIDSQEIVSRIDAGKRVAL